jgi:hypothetical protein
MTSMIEPGRILPMYGPLLGGRRRGDGSAARGQLTVDELAARLLQDMGSDPALLRAVNRVVSRAHRLSCAADAASLLGRASATTTDDDLPAPAVGWWSMSQGPLAHDLDEEERLRATG